MNLYYNYEINDFKRMMMQNEHFINKTYRYFNIFSDQSKKIAVVLWHRDNIILGSELVDKYFQ